MMILVMEVRLVSNNYGFWFTQGNKSLQLPVNPESISINNSSANDSFKVDGLGEITIIQSPDPTKISFNFELPSNYYSGCNYTELIPPQDYYAQLVEMKNLGPIQFLVSGLKISMLVSIEDLSYEEAGGDVGTLHVSIKLKQFNQAIVRELKVVSNKVVIPSNQTTRKPSPIIKPQSMTYKVVKGDTLYIIARKNLGNGARWPEIHKLNKSKIKNPNSIEPGWILQMPKK